MDSLRSPRYRLTSATRAPLSSVSLSLSDRTSVSVRPDSLEQQMKSEADNVLRDWGSSTRTRTEGSLRIRSGSVGSQEQRRSRQRSRLLSSTPSISSPFQLSCPPNGGGIHFDFPEVEILHRDSKELKGLHSGTDECLVNKNHQYFECPATGQRMFRIELDITGFTERDIKVRVEDGRLTVHGVKEENQNGKKSTNEFCRKIKLPKDVCGDRLRCCYINNLLIIEAPARPSAGSYTDSLNTSSSASNERKISLNSPTILSTNSDEKLLQLIVEVGRIFKASDVSVKVNGRKKIIIKAERREESPTSRMTATIQREFELSEPIDRATMDAAFVNNAGLLKITAKIDKENSVRAYIRERHL